MTGSAIVTSFAATSATVSVPDAPGQVSAEIDSPVQVTVKWTPIASATGYRLERASGTSGGVFAVIGTLDASQTSFDDAGLTTDSTYRYRVSSINSAGISSASPVAIVVPAVTTTLDIPADFDASQKTAGKVALSWSGTTNAVAVVIERSTDAGITWTQLNSIPGAQHSYTDPVDRATNYAYRISSKSFTAVSPKSGSISLLTAPPEVAALQRTAVTADSASFTWTASVGATGYLLESSSDNGKTWTPAATVVGGVVSTTVTGLTSGVDYTFRISANNAGGSSATTQIVGVLTIPSTPANIDCALVDGPGVDITFDPVQGASSYLIERRTDGRPWGTLVTLQAPATEYTDIQVDGVRTYEYRVTAINEAGQSAPSEAVAQGSSSTGDGEGVTPPSNLTASAGAKGLINISWEASQADSFTVQQLVGKAYKDIATVTGDTTTYALKGVTANKPATIQIVATVNGTPSDPSDSFTVHALPTAVKAIKTLTSTVPGDVTLTWASPAGAQFYKLERSTDRTTWTSLGDSINAAAYVDNDTDPGTSYAYRVSAGNDTGFAAPSSTLLVTTAPQSPVGVNIAAGAKAGTATLTWGNVAGETGYKIQGSPDGGSTWKQVAAAKPDVTSATLKPGKNTLFRVLSFNKTGSSSPSSPTQYTAPATTKPVKAKKHAATASVFSAQPISKLSLDDTAGNDPLRDLLA